MLLTVTSFLIRLELANLRHRLKSIDGLFVSSVGRSITCINLMNYIVYYNCIVYPLLELINLKNHDCFDNASFPCLLSHMTMLRNRVVYSIFKVTEIHNLHKFGAIILVKQCKVGGVFVPDPRFHVGE